MAARQSCLAEEKICADIQPLIGQCSAPCSEVSTCRLLVHSGGDELLSLGAPDPRGAIAQILSALNRLLAPDACDSAAVYVGPVSFQLLSMWTCRDMMTTRMSPEGSVNQYFQHIRKNDS